VPLASHFRSPPSESLSSCRTSEPLCKPCCVCSFCAQATMSFAHISRSGSQTRIVCVCVREREGERERGREGEREGGREGERESLRERERASERVRVRDRMRRGAPGMQVSQTRTRSVRAVPGPSSSESWSLTDRDPSHHTIAAPATTPRPSNRSKTWGLPSRFINQPMGPGASIDTLELIIHSKFDFRL
jgi:hypothetical protein